MNSLRVAELMQHLAPARRPSPNASGWRALGGIPLAGIAADSRRVRPGFLFAALPGLGGGAGHADGRAFIADAVANGAAAVLAPSGTAWPPGVPPRPLIEDPEPRRRLAELAAAFAGAAPKTVVAVTGTNGKTSTVEFLRQLWQRAGHPAASLGTLGLVTASGREPGALTTPDPVGLAETMARLARERIERVAIEASSHGLDQFRLDGLALAAAGFSSFSRDHLDYHAGMAAYRAAKLRLFDALLPEGAPAVAASSLGVTTLRALRAIARRRHLRFETAGEGGSLIRLKQVTPLPEGQLLTIAGTEILLPLPGRFQAENALLAAGLAMLLGDASALSRLGQLQPVRGRLERAAVLANGACAYVDYAHTPDALKNLLAALRPHTTGRLFIVFGAGGDRDPGKRASMGRAAAAAADEIIVTDDNPRSEDPAAIRRAVLAGCQGAREIGDREQAIAAALSDLGPGDVLAVAGKGHEAGQIVGDHVLPFDDVAVIRRLVGQS
ncbi:MAG TPA: UDP-N-acetylmuramoyl-L-alanyl-D-glutamate--2,6-diaminopimelate ligase [Acetobacteraceae bacterium]|nr:UDP-N-acetylmuramoyl-L-alanyl-D-glutamate--2,6-diaminopimelate ligase [Acetobacteraceae bacterium]